MAISMILENVGKGVGDFFDSLMKFLGMLGEICVLGIILVSILVVWWILTIFASGRGRG